MRSGVVVLLTCALTGLSPARAQTPAPQQRAGDAEGLALSGTVRLRYETIDGQARAGFNSSDELVNLRTTLLGEYRDGPIRAVAELYDSRAYGADAGTPLTTNEVNAFELVQAYVGVSIDDAFGIGSELDVQAGRLLLNIGSRRLVAADDYRNTTNSYTGVRADLTARGGLKATLLYTLPQSRRPDDFEALLDNDVAIDRESFDLVLWGGTASKAKALGPAMLELSYFHLGERDAPARPTRDRSLDTYGGRITREPATGALDYEIEAFRQTGTIRAGLGANAAVQKVSAWFLHADAGYSFAAPWKPRLSIEFDYASGDRPGGRYNRFDTLFGMRRADLAPSGLYNSVGRANILSPGVRMEAAPDKATNGLLTYRPMWLAARQDSFSTTGVRDPSGRSGRFAGHQIDLRIRHWLVREVLRLELDGVLLFKGRFLEDAPNAPPGGTTRYLSLNATASF